MAGITPARWKEMERIAAQNPAIQFPIIITLKEGVSPESLEDAELRVEHRVLNIVTGAASLDAIRRLSKLSEVELVEEDGEFRALHDSGS